MVQDLHDILQNQIGNVLSQLSNTGQWKHNSTRFQVTKTTPQYFSFLHFWSQCPQTLRCFSHKPWIPCSSLKPMRLPEKFKDGWNWFGSLSPPTSGFQILNIDLRTFVGLSAFCEESSSAWSSKPSLLIVRFTKGLMLITPSWRKLTVLMLVMRVRMTLKMFIPFGLLWDSALLNIGESDCDRVGIINLGADVRSKLPCLRECSQKARKEACWRRLLGIWRKRRTGQVYVVIQFHPTLHFFWLGGEGVCW